MLISQVVFSLFIQNLCVTSRISMRSFELSEHFRSGMNEWNTKSDWELQRNCFYATKLKPFQPNIHILAASCFSNFTIIPEIEVFWHSFEHRSQKICYPNMYGSQFPSPLTAFPMKGIFYTMLCSLWSNKTINNAFEM